MRLDRYRLAVIRVVVDYVAAFAFTFLIIPICFQQGDCLLKWGYLVHLLSLHNDAHYCVFVKAHLAKNMLAKQ